MSPTLSLQVYRTVNTSFLENRQQLVKRNPPPQTWKALLIILLNGVHTITFRIIPLAKGQGRG